METANEMRIVPIKYKGRKGYNNLFLADKVLDLTENIIIKWAKAGYNKKSTSAPGSVNIVKNHNYDVTEVELLPINSKGSIDYKISIGFLAGINNNIADRAYLYNIKYYDYTRKICYVFDKEFFEKNKLINLLFDAFYGHWRNIYYTDGSFVSYILFNCTDAACATDKYLIRKHNTRRLLNVFNDEDTGSELISYVEHGFIHCITAPAISKRDNRVKMLYYKRLIDKQPPIESIPNIEDVKSILLKDLFYQCVENNMGYIDYHRTENGFVFEGYENQSFDRLKKELEEDIKKYNLDDLIEDVDGQYIAGYGCLETVFKFPSGCVVNAGNHYTYVFKKGEE